MQASSTSTLIHALLAKPFLKAGVLMDANVITSGLF